MAESVLVLITKPPYGFEEAFAGMRLSLAMVASGLIPDSAVLLMGDGTLNAVASQDASVLGMPSNLEALEDLGDLDVDVYCIKDDYYSRAGELPTPEFVRMVDWEAGRRLIDEYEIVTTF